MTRVNLEFKEGLPSIEKAALLTGCYQCGICVGDCPAARYAPSFNPREIVMRVALGLVDGLLDEGSILWECTTCYTCSERCPQDVHPIDVITALKNLMAREGRLPKKVAEAVENIKRTGRIALVSEAIHRRRRELGLHEVLPAPVAELSHIWRV